MLFVFELVLDEISICTLSSCFDFLRSMILKVHIIDLLGIPRPKATDQPSLIAVVVKLVKKMIPQFNNGDIRYVRCPRTGKNGVLNVECRNINVASAVKSTFAGLVKSDKPPSYLKNVGYVSCLKVSNHNYIICPIFLLLE